MLDHARSADANADDLIRLSYAVKSPSHKRIVPRRIAEYHQFGAAQCLLIPCQFSRTLDYLSHFAYTIHIDSRFRRTEIHGRANEICGSKCLRNGINQDTIAMRKSFFHQCGKTTDKIDTDLFCGPVHRFCYRYVCIRPAGIRSNSNRRDRYTLMNNRNSVFGFNILTGFYQKFRRFCNLVIHIPAKLFHIGMCAIPQRNPHRDRPHIELVLRDHCIGF